MLSSGKAAAPNECPISVTPLASTDSEALEVLMDLPHVDSNLTASFGKRVSR